MIQANHDRPKTLSNNLFPVVGVGASAGGLEAFKQLLKAIPENSGVAYILVQHLDPFHESILPDILQRVTSIPVLEVMDNITVVPDHIYIIPANKILIANDGVLKLEARPPKPEKNMPIDIFFESLAEVHEDHAIGVILSGTGTDGTLGLKAIKDHGGITFAQQLDSAHYDGMPLSAMQSEKVDFVLRPGEIPGKLLELSHTYINPVNPRDGGHSEKENVYKQILVLLRLRRPVDFIYYKQSIIRRRILSRMVINKIENLAEYFSLLQNNLSEQDSLYADLLIPDTSFFRDMEIFDNLCGTVFPALVKNKSLTDPIRIWIAGCSTGEEAYSIAICLSEFLRDNANIKIQLFATDISEKAIAKARSGIYLKSELENVSESRLQEFFNKTNGHYQVKKTLRDMCVFALHNFLKDPSFARMDLISCRNVLIYMEPYLQKKALASFHYALKGNALLQMGKSETTDGSAELFSTKSKTCKLYARKEVPLRLIPLTPGRSERVLKQTGRESAKIAVKKEDFQKIADDILLSAYTPVGVVVNDLLDIVQYRGSTGSYLEAPPGKPSVNVIKMAREGLGFELRSLLHKAKTGLKPVTKENIPVENGKRMVTIEVIPLLNTIEIHFLILFKNTIENNREITSTGDDKDGEIARSPEYFRIRQLEKELAYSREAMRRITEDQAAANEELQSTNEELHSGSEELQSMNEELETSRDEIQNTFEQLIIVNRELYERNEQFNNERRYSQAIVKTMSQPLLVLNEELRVQRSNNAFHKTFKVTAAETEGKLLYELGNRQWDIPALHSSLKNILNEKSFEDFEVSQTFPGIGEKTMMLNASQLFKENSNEQLILLAMEDITEKNALDKKERELAVILAEIAAARIAVLETIPQCTWTANVNGDITYVNKFFLSYTGMTESETLLWGWTKVVDPHNGTQTYKKYKKLIQKAKDFELEFLMKRNRDHAYRWHLLRALAIRDQAGTIISWVGTSTDIHDQVLFAEVLEKQVAERTRSLKIANTGLEHSNKNLEQFAYIASHDLQEPLRKIQVFSSMLKDYYTGMPDKAKYLINKIDSSSQQMAELIRDVLNFSKLTLSELTFVKTDLNEVLNNMLSEFDLMIREKKAIIHKEVLPLIEAIPLQMTQLFYNLIGNALKFSSSGRDPVITISCKILSPTTVKDHAKLNPELSYCELVFKDNGIGFEQQFADKVFLIFQRLHGHKLYAGTGIGLALCQNIAINHSGEIWVEAIENEGATFHILLPLMQTKIIDN